MKTKHEHINNSRRGFLKTAGATGAGLSTLGLTACGGNSPDTAAGKEPVVVADPGTFVYQKDSYALALNLGEINTGGCTYSAESKNYKVRALFHDAMYWKIVMDGINYLMQWHRTSFSNTNSEASIVGTWVNDYGHQLTFATSGEVTFASTGSGCASYGYLGETALSENIFRQSIAAGDPSSDGLILWTRADNNGSGVAVNWEVSTNHRFSSTVATGSIMTSDSDDFTAKIVVSGLTANSTYFYRFYTDDALDAAGNRQYSHVGRAKTLPIGSVDKLKIALLSCSSYPHGYFNAYRQVARKDDLDGCYHLGDYVYEYPGDPSAEPENSHDYKDDDVVAGGRTYRYGNTKETEELTDYRLRFRNYREDIDLQLLHTRYSFINTWDDHETTNDSYDPDGPGIEGGAENHGDAGRDEGLWEDRKAAAAQAYNEWLPITDIRSKGDGTFNDPRLDRGFSYGDLADLIVIDTRVGGRHNVANTQTDSYTDDTRKLYSDDQRTFTVDSLTNSQATWKLLGQQIMMGHLIGPPLISNDAGISDTLWNCVINNDQWDGYDSEREVIFETIKGNALTGNDIDNFICLTGDIHTSWAINLVDDPRKRLPNGTSCQGVALNPLAYTESENYGVEFVTPSITSPGLDDPGGSLTTGLRTNNPHIQGVDLVNRGYSILELTPTKASCTWYHVASITDEENETESLWKIFSTTAGTNQLVEETP